MEIPTRKLLELAKSSVDTRLRPFLGLSGYNERVVRHFIAVGSADESRLVTLFRGHREAER